MSDPQRNAENRRTPEPLMPGQRLGEHGNYRLKRLLGQGGMGQTWLAAEFQGGKKIRSVVCKIIPPAVQKRSEEMKLLVKVFVLTRSLNHTNICPLYGMNHDPVFGWFYVMGFANGGTLQDWFLKQPDYRKGLPLAKVVNVLRPIASALDYAAEMGVVHRDVKPQNILFSGPKRTPWLIDFGLAAQIHEADSATMGKMALAGTPIFMSPEQCRGDVRQDGRTDQYALATIAYLFLSGCFPFNGNSLALWGQIVNLPPTPISGQPQSVNDALLKALSKSLDGRFPTCTKFIDALEARDEPQNAQKPKRSAVRKKTDFYSSGGFQLDDELVGTDDRLAPGSSLEVSGSKSESFGRFEAKFNDLCQLIQSRQESTILKFLKGSTFSFKEARHDGASLLHLAVRQELPVLASYLIKSGSFNINERDSEGNTPLHLAAQNGNLAIASELILNGASVCRKNRNGKTPLDLAYNSEMRQLLFNHEPTFSAENRKGCILAGYWHFLILMSSIFAFCDTSKTSDTTACICFLILIFGFPLSCWYGFRRHRNQRQKNLSSPPLPGDLGKQAVGCAAGGCLNFFLFGFMVCLLHPATPLSMAICFFLMMAFPLSCFYGASFARKWRKE